MKIAVLTSSFPRFPGDGTAPFIQSICENLASLGHEVHVIAPFDVDVRPIETNGINIKRFQYIWPASLHIMGHSRSLEADVRLKPIVYIILPLFLISEFIALLRLAVTIKPEVIHAHWVIPNGFSAALVCKLFRIPLIISLHGSDIFVAQKNIFFRSVTRWIFQQAAAVTACSPELHQAAIRLGSKLESTYLLAWGADPDKFNPEHLSTEFKERLGLTHENVVVGTLGRMVHKKGFDILINAMPEVVAHIPGTRFVFGGDGSLRTELENKVKEMGLQSCAVFPGSIPWYKVPEFLSSVDIFILPSIRDTHGNLDGLPTVLLEAMASGKPVIASRVGGVELVIKDRKNGILFDPGDVNQLVKELLQLCKDANLRSSLGDAARSSVIEEFNWQNVATKIVSIYESAIWKRNHTYRLGSAYRHEMLTLLDRLSSTGEVLDVGCHDGLFLNSVSAPKRVGVDLEPRDPPPGVNVIQADGCLLPFPDNSFKSVFALEVIEHVPEDDKFAQSISRVISAGGRLFLTTPSANIRMNPPFLTGWISKEWGHYMRRGYTEERLRDLFQPHLDEVKVTSWNAPTLRLWYIPVRLLYFFWPQLGALFVRKLAHWDFHRRKGEEGYLILEGFRAQDE